MSVILIVFEAVKNWSFSELKTIAYAMLYHIGCKDSEDSVMMKGQKYSPPHTGIYVRSACVHVMEYYNNNRRLTWPPVRYRIESYSC